FVVPKAQEDSVDCVVQYLLRGKHVVLEFGKYDNLLAYLLVANVLTRRIHERWVQRVEAATSDAEKPPKLVITIEEAHKFLNPKVAGLTAFGAIAREMRKYNVTLLVVDQRPSGIDEEVMSQLGTRITCLLDNDKDIDSVLMGVSGKTELRQVLAKLETKQQALIFGHAVPMPVVIQTREYGSAESYKEFGYLAPEEAKARAKQDVSDLYGD
ncbi:MAG: ATP-binding protein, partial [Dehalococcoidia bacterium]|nr:ATP-binding protein [Dehalococcoidia bacterium]